MISLEQETLVKKTRNYRKNTRHEMAIKVSEIEVILREKNIHQILTYNRSQSESENKNLMGK